MFFRTEDEQQLKKLVAADKADRQQLERLEAQLEALRPKWLAIQERLEGLCSAYGNNDRSYARVVYEPFWRDREAWLKAETERLVAERDALTSTLPPQITALKAKLHRRRSIVIDDFGG